MYLMWWRHDDEGRHGSEEACSRGTIMIIMSTTSDVTIVGLDGGGWREANLVASPKGAGRG